MTICRCKRRLVRDLGRDVCVYCLELPEHCNCRCPNCDMKRMHSDACSAGLAHVG